MFSFGVRFLVSDEEHSPWLSNQAFHCISPEWKIRCAEFQKEHVVVVLVL